MNLRVPIDERTLCVPHRKHDIIDVLKCTTALNGEPPTLDW